MGESIRALRAKVHQERGMTLPELLVAMFVFATVMLVFTQVLASVQRGVVRQDNLNSTLNEARLAVQQLDREIRSGNVLYDPALENAGQPSCTGCLPNLTLRIYTQANADTRSTYYCTLWKIDDNQRLMTRYWPPDNPGAASSWRVVATGVVNRSLSPAENAFVRDSDPLKGGRTLNVTLAVNANLSRYPTQTTRVQAALTGRNTAYGYPINVCQSTPAG